MASLFTNWKTTLAGVGAILSGLGTLATSVSSGHTTSTTIATTIAAVLSGLGLFAAKDGSSSS